MKVTAYVFGARHATVHIETSWLERIFLGRKTSTRIAVRIDTIRGERVWCWVEDGRRIDRDTRGAEIVAALRDAEASTAGPPAETHPPPAA